MVSKVFIFHIVNRIIFSRGGNFDVKVAGMPYLGVKIGVLGPLMVFINEMDQQQSFMAFWGIPTPFVSVGSIFQTLLYLLHVWSVKLYKVIHLITCKPFNNIFQERTIAISQTLSNTETIFKINPLIVLKIMLLFISPLVNW